MVFLCAHYGTQLQQKLKQQSRIQTRIAPSFTGRNPTSPPSAACFAADKEGHVGLHSPILNSPGWLSCLYYVSEGIEQHPRHTIRVLAIERELSAFCSPSQDDESGKWSTMSNAADSMRPRQPTSIPNYRITQRLLRNHQLMITYLHMGPGDRLIECYWTDDGPNLSRLGTAPGAVQPEEEKKNT